MAPGGSVDHLVSDRVVRAHDLGGPFAAGLKGRALAVMSEDACRQHAKGHRWLALRARWAVDCATSGVRSCEWTV